MLPPGTSKYGRKDYKPPNECPDKSKKCADGNDPQHPHWSEFVILIRGHGKYCRHREREHDKDKDYMVPQRARSEFYDSQECHTLATLPLCATRQLATAVEAKCCGCLGSTPTRRSSTSALRRSNRWLSGSPLYSLSNSGEYANYKQKCR